MITVVGLLLIDHILWLFGASPNVLPYARDYLKIITLGTMFQMVGFGLNAAIRGEGNPRIAMLSMFVSVVVNVILAPVFIFGFGWGMQGAALATVMAQAATAAWVVLYFLGGTSVLQFRARNLRLDWAICRSIVAIGSPACVMQLAASLLWSVLNNQLQTQGDKLSPRRRPGRGGDGRHLRRDDDGVHADLRAEPGGAADHRLQLRGPPLRPGEEDAGDGHPAGHCVDGLRLRCWRGCFPRRSSGFSAKRRRPRRPWWRWGPTRCGFAR